MRDLEIILPDRPGALAAMGEALGAAGVSVEGGGAWVVDGRGVAHFLVANAEAGRQALEAGGMTVVADREVITLRLAQATSGQLGLLARRMADAGVNITALYSDHDHRLILVVDNLPAAQRVADTWMLQQLR